MLESNLKTVRNDFNTLLRDAQALLREAAGSTGTKADELRARGMQLLEEASGRAKELQTAAVQKGKELVDTTDDYVHEHPWQAVAVGAGVGLLVGMLIARR